MKKTGIVVFLLGLGLTVFSTITFFTREKVVNLGKVEISRQKEHHLNISPFIGVSIMAIGGILYWHSNRAL
ncbi:MAG: hypothetical protein HGA37_02965 [Lentimicrobium sp.]|nr:hypothetical protein [Lentimicrobium sp.]